MRRVEVLVPLLTLSLSSVGLCCLLFGVGVAGVTQGQRVRGRLQFTQATGGTGRLAGIVP